VMKRGNARGAQGAGHRHLARVNRQREEPDIQWKVAAFARWLRATNRHSDGLPVNCEVGHTFSDRDTARAG
jgi:hypothetical protein